MAYELVGWPSVTGTPDEASFSVKLAERLRQLPYFRDNPDDVAILPVPGDPNSRANVFALVRGRGAKTVIFSGHFDVVPVDDYGDLAPLAGEPDALAPALLERLSRTGEHPLARADLESGAFVPGRGMLDMKSGIAAGIAVLDDFSRSEDREGNLLLVATPDEEENSCGMRAAAASLPKFVADRALEPRLAINLDATCDNGDGREGRIVAMGTIGKLLLTACVIGKEAHACYPFDGINAGYLAAELAAEFECAPELADGSADQRAAPPSTLALKDGKSLYNVTSPGRAWAYWNVLVYRNTPDRVLSISCDLAKRATARAWSRLRERATAAGSEMMADDATPRVITYEQLHEAAAARAPDFAARLDEKAARLATASVDLPERSRQLTEWVWDNSGLEGPAVVLGFGSMPYPAVAWPDDADAAQLERSVFAAVDEIAAREDMSFARRDFFPAISDMSFLGRVDSETVDAMARNTPLWGSSVTLGTEDAGMAIPIVNIGPWGRDYHHWLERTHADYTFRVLPDLLKAVFRRVLDPR